MHAYDRHLSRLVTASQLFLRFRRIRPWTPASLAWIGGGHEPKRVTVQTQHALGLVDVLDEHDVRTTIWTLAPIHSLAAHGESRRLFAFIIPYME